MVATINEESFSGDENILNTSELNYISLNEDMYHFENSDGDYLDLRADSYSSSSSLYVKGEIDGYKINLYTQNIDFTRYIAASSMSLSAEKTTLELDETITIDVLYNPSNATGVGVDEISWTVDNPDVLYVYNDTTSASQGLYVEASNPGNVKVTATNGDGISASIDLVVNEPTLVESITLSTEGNVNSVEQYKNLQINAEVIGVDGKTPYDSTLTWSSSDDEVLSVNDKGVVTGLKVSSEPVTITATANDGSGVSGSIKISVTESTTTSIIPEENVGVYSGYDDYSIGIELTLNSDGSAYILAVDYDETTPTELTFVRQDGRSYFYTSSDGQEFEIYLSNDYTIQLYYSDSYSFYTAEGNEIYIFSGYLELSK